MYRHMSLETLDMVTMLISSVIFLTTIIFVIERIKDTIPDKEERKKYYLGLLIVLISVVIGALIDPD